MGDSSKKWVAAAAPFVFSTGLQLSGYVNAAVGVTLMAMSFTWGAAVVAGPPAFRAFARKVVEVGGVDPKAPTNVHAVVERVRGELKHNLRLLERAEASGEYPNPDRQLLAAGEWGYGYPEIANAPSLRAAYRAAHAAYDECDRINQLVIGRANPFMDEAVTVEDSDDLPEAVRVVSEGIAALDTAGEQWH